MIAVLVPISESDEMNFDNRARVELVSTVPSAYVGYPLSPEGELADHAVTYPRSIWILALIEMPSRPMGEEG